MAAEGVFAGAGLQNLVLALSESLETGTLRVLHALGLAPDAHGQAAWPFASRIATETLALDAGLARQLAGAVAAAAVAVLLVAWGAARRRARAGAWTAALGVLLLAPWPARSLILADARASSFQHSPTGFTTDAIARGLALYRTDCAACHGDDGRGEGPRAAGLPVWPPRLGGELLWRRAEGDLFGVVMDGLRDRHGRPTMPGFAGRIADADAWALVAALKALAAGDGVRTESAWRVPVRAPDARLHCDDGTPDRPLSALRGQRLRLVADAGGAAVPGEDPRLVTVLLEAPSATARAGCVVRGQGAWQAYAEVAGAAPGAFAGTQLLVDRDGWLRAVGAPGRAAWSRDDVLCRSARPAAPARRGADGLGELLAAIDADPVRSDARGIAHLP